MPLIKRIHCIVDPEPLAFHQTGDLPYAVHLNFECESSDANDGAAAGQAFQDFFRAIKTVDFYLFAISDGTAAQINNITYWTKVGAVKKISGDTSLGDEANLLRWLAGSPDRWLSPTVEPLKSSASQLSKPEVVDVSRPEKIRATHILRGSQSWAAPVPHSFGLTHLLHLNIPKPLGQGWVILPFFANPPEDGMSLTPRRTPDALLWDFIYDPGAGFQEIWCRTHLLQAPAEGHFGGRLMPEGYFTVTSQSDEDWRLLLVLEERSANLMTPFQALSELPKCIFKPTKSNDGTILSPNVSFSAWRACAALTVLLDPLVIALRRPGSASDSTEGHILSYLVSRILEQVQDHLTNKGTSQLQSKTITAGLRAYLGKSRLFGDQQQLVTALRLIHNLPSASIYSDASEIALYHLLDFLAAPPPSVPPDPSKAEPQKIDDADPFVAITAISRKLHEEDGLRAAIISIFESAATKPEIATDEMTDAIFAKATANQFNAELDPADKSKLQAAVADAWRQFKSALSGSFNALEAVRRSGGSDFVQSLVRHNLVGGKDVAQKLMGADCFSSRLFPDGVSLFKEIWQTLPQIPFPDDRFLKSIRKCCHEAYSSTISHITDQGGANSRFMPDSLPRPLPIQIASNCDAAAFHKFAEEFNGIAVAIRRRDKPNYDRKDAWAHANLAELEWPNKNENDGDGMSKAGPAIFPLLPAIADGAGPMFVNYDGFPFASAAFGETTSDPAAGTGRRAFYAHDVLDQYGNFAKIPRLAYGRRFESFSFAITNAGSLPRQLQGGFKPWLPAEDIVPPTTELIFSLPYQRRTMIGSVSVVEDVTPPRIGATVDGVVPLSADYPRLAMHAKANAPGVMDLMRDSDGRGMLTILPESSTTALELHDLFWSGKAMLTVAFFDKAAVSPEDQRALASHDLTEEDAGGTLLIRLEKRGDGLHLFINGTEVSQTETFEPYLWCRLTLTTKTGTTTLSFSDPTAEKHHAAPLLLLSSSEPNQNRTVPKSPNSNDPKAWNGKTPTTISAKIVAPRVGYLDFERWFANGSLKARAFHNGNDTLADSFLQMLLTAYTVRHSRTKTLGKTELAKAVSRLPDPAVDILRIELTLLDNLTDVMYDTVASMDICISDQLLRFAEEFIKPHNGDWDPCALVEVLEALEAKFHFKLKIQSGDALRLELQNETAAQAPVTTLTASDTLRLDLQKATWIVTVPRGVAAVLSVTPCVPLNHFDDIGLFPSVFNPGLSQYATRQAKIDGATYLLFPPASIAIETMLDGICDNKDAIRLADQMFSCKSSESSRSYDLVAAYSFERKDQDATKRGDQQWKKDRQQWRIFSEIDITSQRWRPSGRPIYNYVSPKQIYKDCGGVPVPSPSVAFPLKLDDKLAQFENEAFFDRSNLDATTITQRLNPLPAQTILQQVPWSAPSATYFRHRFALRSRYAGALNDPARQSVAAWQVVATQSAEYLAKEWTMRVAVLADLSRLPLTRPQLRALIPLTAAPSTSGGSSSSAPPVLAWLQEPPFARGGLADRIAAEIKTGLGYGFPPRNASTPAPSVEILDSRKEIGPDPRLSYTPTPIDSALGAVLAVEGPIGLTFDSAIAPAPAFPNSSILLTPSTVCGEATGSFEEHFLGVSMRRYIDPDWAVSDDDDAGKPNYYSGDRCWWIEFKEKLATGSLISPHWINAEGQAEDKPPLLEICNDANDFRIKVYRAFIDTSNSNEPIEITRFSKGVIEKLAILHIPVAVGRYSTTIMGFLSLNSGSAGEGRANVPFVLASFEWSPPSAFNKDGKPVKPPTVMFPQSSDLIFRAAVASQPTFLAWTRTSQDFDRCWVAFIEKDNWKTEQVSTSTLVPTKINDTLSFTRSRSNATEVWLSSSIFAKPYPLHVHRHVALIATRSVPGPGRAMEAFCGAVMADTRSIALSEPLKNAEHVRIVEFETPASILCARNSDQNDVASIPLAYQSAYFDLKATGWEEGCPVRLFFRFVGSQKHIANFGSLTVSLDAVAIGRISLTNINKQCAVGLDVTLLGNSAYVHILYFDGHKEDVKSQIHFTPRRPGFTASLVAPGNGEFWTDVSLLHSPRLSIDGTTVDFDLGWLFSPTDQAFNPADAVKPDALVNMYEVQARIISVSPPIAIVEAEE